VPSLIEPSTELVTMTDVAKSYVGQPPVDVLHDVNLRLCTGRSYAVAGPSGSGKSTLLNILGLLEAPSAGRYLVGDIDTVTMSDRERTNLRARWLGFVFQAFHLVPYLTALENVEVPLLHHGVARRERRSLALEALDRVGLSYRLDAFPATLSGGERQRVAIARAVVHRPRLILCDEPTGNLDSATGADVLSLLVGLMAENRCLVVVTHDASVAQHMDFRVEVRDGRVSSEAVAR
jgi:putative ABC transport system ATP-binding protein